MRVDELLPVEERDKTALAVCERLINPVLVFPTLELTLGDADDVLDDPILRVKDDDDVPLLVLAGDRVFVGELLALFVLIALALTVLDTTDVFETRVELVDVFVVKELKLASGLEVLVLETAGDLVGALDIIPLFVLIGVIVGFRLG